MLKIIYRQYNSEITVAGNALVVRVSISRKSREFYLHLPYALNACARLNITESFGLTEYE